MKFNKKDIDPNILLYLAGGIGAYYFIIKPIFEALNLKKSEEEEEAEETVKEEIKQSEKKILPSYNDAAYMGFADSIYSAGTSGFSGDYNQLYSITDNIKNDTDFLKLYKAFGKRRPNFTLQYLDLSGFIRHTFKPATVNTINKGFALRKLKNRL